MKTYELGPNNVLPRGVNRFFSNIQLLNVNFIDVESTYEILFLVHQHKLKYFFFFKKTCFVCRTEIFKKKVKEAAFKLFLMKR